MQQSNYIEAEDAYRRALTIAPDNNKMCNLGICLMKQGRITEAKENLRRVKPAVADGPRGTDSHLKAYERAQQMLKDLESELLNKGGDRVEQSRLFDAFLGSSSIWQPQPCRDSVKLPQDEFGDENTNSSNILGHDMTTLPQQKPMKQVLSNYSLINSLNVAAQPFYSSKFALPVAQAPPPIPESLKRTRSGNAATSMKLNNNSNNNLAGEIATKAALDLGIPENKTRRLSAEKGAAATELLLPDNKDFEDAIIAAVLGPPQPTSEALKMVVNSSSIRTNSGNNASGVVPQMKIEKRLKVFQDITLSLSPTPRA